MVVPKASLAPYLSFSLSMITTTFLVLIIIPYSSPLEFDYPNFEEQNRNELVSHGYGRYLGSELELTTNKTDQIGRLTFVAPLHLWENSSGTLALSDFTTEFSFVVYAYQMRPGDGIAFFLAKPPYEIPKVIDGSTMGLFEPDEKLSNLRGLVAVEFDTLRNDFDPQDLDQHVGINVNSMISKVTTAWSCDIMSQQVYNASINYDSRSKNLSVLFTGYRDKIQIQQFISYEIDLAAYLPEWVRFGFSAANGLYTSRHILRSWSFNSTLKTERSTTTTNNNSESKTSKTELVVGLSVGAFVFVSFLGLIGIVFWKKRNKKGEDDDDDDLNIDLYMDEDFERNSGARKFSYDELLFATNNFAEENKLGQGGFGGVYKGFLKNLNSFVAIKKVSSVSNQGIKEYATEVKIISQLRHRNLVQLIGWCHRKKDLLLIYEFMSNGSLDSHLFKQKSLLTWIARYNIARGLASALLYLHEEWEQCVLHRDIKSSNVMLDSQFNAKLGDFGLARLVDHDKGSQTTMLAGTLGYMAPECVATSRASRESDIYSFGVVALEIVCGRRAIEPHAQEGKTGLVEWVWELYGLEKILEASDPKLCREFDEQQMERLMVVGLWCAHPDYRFRPSIKQAIQVLNFEAPLPILPRDMPVPTYLPHLVHPSEVSNSPIWSSGTSASFEINGYETKSSSNKSHFTTPSELATSSKATTSPSTALLSSRQ